MEGCGECDDEAMRVVAIMPRWKPARLNGKLVKTYFNIPFSFKVQRQTSCLAERDARSKASVYYATANMGNRFIQLIQGGYLSTETKIVSEKPDLYENKKGFDP